MSGRQPRAAGSAPSHRADAPGVPQVSDVCDAPMARWEAESPTVPRATAVSPAPALILPGAAPGGAEPVPPPVLRCVERAHARAQHAQWSASHVRCAATCTDPSLIVVERTLIVVARALTLSERATDFMESTLSCMRRTPRRTTLVRDVGALIPDLDALDTHVCGPLTGLYRLYRRRCAVRIDLLPSRNDLYALGRGLLGMRIRSCGVRTDFYGVRRVLY